MLSSRINFTNFKKKKYKTFKIKAELANLLKEENHILKSLSNLLNSSLILEILYFLFLKFLKLIFEDNITGF